MVLHAHSNFPSIKKKHSPTIITEVMDWKGARMINFTIDEVDKNNLDPELREYIRSIKNDI
jgi:hypothetical protein